MPAPIFHPNQFYITAHYLPDMGRTGRDRAFVTKCSQATCSFSMWGIARLSSCVAGIGLLDTNKRVYQEQRYKKIEINGIDSVGREQMRYLIYKIMILFIFSTKSCS
jgi:hypothetical protein